MQGVSPPSTELWILVLTTFADGHSSTSISLPPAPVLSSTSATTRSMDVPSLWSTRRLTPSVEEPLEPPTPSPLVVAEEDEEGCAVVEVAPPVDEVEQRAAGRDESGTMETSPPQPRRTTSTMPPPVRTKFEASLDSVPIRRAVGEVGEVAIEVGEAGEGRQVDEARPKGGRSLEPRLRELSEPLRPSSRAGGPR